MPGLDDRLEQAVRGAALLPDGDPDAVTTAIAVKRRRRRARRRAATGLAVAMVVVAALTTTIVVVSDRDANDVQVATNETTPPTTTAPPPTTTTVPPEVVEDAQEQVVAAAPTGYAVEPGDVTVVAPDEAVATVTDAAGISYVGVRFAQDGTGWTMVPASACRLPAADPAICATVEPDVLFTPGTVRLDREAYNGVDLPTTRLTVDPDRYVRGPLLATWRLEFAAAYERRGPAGWDYPPSHVIGFTPQSTAGVTRADLEGEILSFAEGGEVLWAVTHERFVDADRVEYRLKRIDTATGKLNTMPLPPDAVPAGPVVASAGGAWVPLRDGVIGFPHSGTVPTRINLPEQDTRDVAIIDGRVYATSGSAIRRIDAGARTAEVVLETGGIEPLTGLVATDTSVWALAGTDLLGLDRDLSVIETRGGLPPGLRAATLHADTSQVWATGVADLAPTNDGTTRSVAEEPVAVLIDDSGIAATLVLAGAVDSELTVSPNGIVITSGGTAYRVTLPE
ncbi:MAG: hypothetical protein ACRDY6_15040 [Acidimicrobiia bacterium]